MLDGEDCRNATIERHSEELEGCGTLIRTARSDWEVDRDTASSLIIYLREISSLLD